ncbi:hypothetical protein PV516_19130 [Streptomyces scabiei]|uniref:hypothetical protein n=1 Tax=Streptomyces scabiei TaxID=1930 RepID=UPI0029B75DB5|nr:hypothetical protein [Streptomyces scabiei]MDX3165902.1 hypothetical protein [Streptomyces scabiei]
MAQRWWTLAKQDMATQVADRGHTLTWKQIPRPTLNHALAFEGTCCDCGATVTIGSGWSSCATIRDARNSDCSGPGTAALTEVEQDRAGELANEVIGEFLETLADLGITPTRPKEPFRDPFAPEGRCGLMSKDGYTCNRRLNRRGTHNLNEWSGPDHVGTHPDDDFTMPFSDDDLLLA